MSDKIESARFRIEAHAAGLEATRKTVAVATDLATVNDFLVKLCEDPAQVAAFKADPDGVLAAAGINKDLAQLMKAGQAYVVGRFGSQFGGRGGVVSAGDNTVTVVVVVVVVV
jgi:hypothetical protein